MPENPPERWVECPPSGAHVHDACPCDTSAGVAASQIYLGNQSEPRASLNPAGDSSAFLPVIGQRFIANIMEENTDLYKKHTTNSNIKHCRKRNIKSFIYLFYSGIEMEI